MARMQLSPHPRLQFLDANGVPLAGGLLYTYTAGTTNPLATYLDSAGTPNTNPVVLDAAGRATVYLGTSSYKFVLLDSNSVSVFTQDNVTSNYIDTSSAQTMSNKTLDDTNIIHVKDTALHIEKDSDPTATVRISAESIASGQERVMTAPDADLVIAGQNFANVFTKRQQLGKGANVASAGDLVLGTAGNSFTITGTTTINAITTAGWAAGSVVTLFFNGLITVKYDTAGGTGTAIILLQGADDFHAGSLDSLTLLYDGTVWIEIARAVHSTTANGLFRTAVVTIAHAAILTLPTTPVVLVANPGLLRMLELLEVKMHMNMSTAAYTNVDPSCIVNVRVSAGEGMPVSEDGDHSLFDAGASKYIGTLHSKNEPLVRSRASWENANFNLVVDNAAAGIFTGGDTGNVLTVYVTYVVQVLP